MSSINKYSNKLVDDTIPLQALLYDDEQLFISQHGVALYDGQFKSINHQSGSIHLSSHRLFYISSSTPSSNSLFFNLNQISHSDYYAGFLKSSPKIILQFVPIVQSNDSSATTSTWDSWECAICAYRNPPGLSPDASAVCALCGVPRDAVPSAPISIPIATRPNAIAARSLPSSPPPSQDLSSIPCSACTFLNHPSLLECEICGTKLTRSNSNNPFTPKHLNSLSLSSTTSSKSAPSSRPSSPSSTAYNDDDDDAHPPTIKLSFRKGGDKAFYAAFKRAVSSKSWLANVPNSRYNIAQSTNSNEAKTGRSGINGILRTLDTTHTNHTADMQEAFRDLEALMRKAREMVGLARELNERLVALEDEKGKDINEAESKTTQTQKFIIHNSLSQLGMTLSDAPVMLDSNNRNNEDGDGERRWMEELARELAVVLLGPRISSSPSSLAREYNNKVKKKGMGLMDRRGIISLDEVWGGWNRARGVALLPPGVLLQVVPHLERYTREVASERERERGGERGEVEICARKLRSGLFVLHTSRFALGEFGDRVRGYLGGGGEDDDESSIVESTSSLSLNANASNKTRTTTHIAHLESLSYALAEEMLVEAEMEGWLCRDDPRAFYSSSSSSRRDGDDFSSAGSGAGGVDMEIRWYVNEWVGYVWDGMVLD